MVSRLTKSLHWYRVSTENDDPEPKQVTPPPRLSAAGRKKFDDEDVEDEVKVRSQNPVLTHYGCTDTDCMQSWILCSLDLVGRLGGRRL